MCGMAAFESLCKDPRATAEARFREDITFLVGPCEMPRELMNDSVDLKRLMHGLPALSLASASSQSLRAACSAWSLSSFCPAASSCKYALAQCAKPFLVVHNRRVITLLCLPDEQIAFSCMSLVLD